MDMNLNRRHFIVDSVAAGTLLPALGRPVDTDVFRGFIVSDAHFGWHGKWNGELMQPAPEVQRKAMRNIINAFADLDLMIDTGDAHHGSLRGEDGDVARGNWTDIIPGVSGSLPFMYVPGNHEIMGWTEGDPEWRCNRLGSLCCRPYYSFDIKGIHFVSIPELMMAVYVTKETIEWLKLDLEVNRGKTIVLLSHNHIIGTTGPDEEGYRGLVNSQEMMEIIETHPNIIAWMHGHNHNYQVVKKKDRLFVSNGRIGGFDPSRGRYGIGGIYFEIGKNGMKVRSFDAEQGRILTPADGPELGDDLSVLTSYDPNESFSYSYGAGGSRDAERIPVINHYAGGKNEDRLYVAGADGPMISEDPKFTLYQCRRSNNHKQLFGFIVRDPENLWGWDDPGIRLYKRDDGKDIRVTIPHYGAGQCAYYRCPPDKTYRVVLDIEAETAGPVLDLQFLWFDRNGKQLAQWNMPKYEIPKGRRIKVFETEAPDPEKLATIYVDPQEDNVLNFVSQAIFSSMSAEVKVHGFRLEMTGSGVQTLNPVVSVDERPFAREGLLAVGDVAVYEVPAFRSGRQVIGTGAQGNGRLTWLIRREGLDWQVRNAPVSDRGAYLEIGELRNPWTFNKEICIAPLFPCSEIHVSRLSKVKGAKIYPLNRGNKTLQVVVDGTLDSRAVVEIISPFKPKLVMGSKHWEYKDGRLLVEVDAGSRIEIEA